jgi:hypothetical protein
MRAVRSNDWPGHAKRVVLFECEARSSPRFRLRERLFCSKCIPVDLVCRWPRSTFRKVRQDQDFSLHWDCMRVKCRQFRSSHCSAPLDMAPNLEESGLSG